MMFFLLEILKTKGRKMKSRTRLTAFLIFAIYCLTFAAAVQGSVDKGKLEKALTKIASYEYGQPREVMTDLADIVRAASANPGDAKLVEKSLLKTLKSKATLAGRDYICRQLFIVGSEESASILGSMLADEKTTDMARYALERIGGDAIDEVLMDALKKTSGKAKIGVINSLGNRQIAKAVPALNRLVYDNNSEIAFSALLALGNIADEQAVRVLGPAKEKMTGKLKIAALEAYLKCADKLLAQGKSADALAIYKKAYAENNPRPIRFAALQGMINASGEKAVDVIVDTLKSKDAELQEIAIASVINVSGEKIVPAVTAELADMSPIAQAQLLSALAERGDSAGLPAAVKATKASDPSVRLAALRALGKLGNTSTVGLLVEIATATKGAEQETARKSLYNLKGPAIDARIVEAIDSARSKAKAELIKATAQRYVYSAVAMLLKTAGDSDRRVRLESIKALRELAGSWHVPALVDILVNAKSRSERSEAERAVVAAANKIADRTIRDKAVRAKLIAVEDVDIKSSLLAVLGKIGHYEALGLLRQTLNSDSEKLKTAAIKGLSDWYTAEPADDLLKIAQTSNNQVHKTLALRGYVRLVGIDDKASAAEKVEKFKLAMDLAPNLNEKKMVLSGLADVASYKALEVAAGYLNEPALLAEAQAAVIKIAEATKGADNPEKTKQILQKVIQQTSNDALKKQAEKALSRIK